MNPPLAASRQQPHRVDAHAHVFSSALPLALERRYAPACEAPPETYVKFLDAHEIGNAVLVQPSFLGTDNSYMLRAIAESQGRFKGVAVVSPDITTPDLLALRRAGVTGIRLNLVQRPYPNLHDLGYANLWRELAELGLHVELHREASDANSLIEFLLDHGLTVVVDHFGRPNPQQGTGDTGFRKLLSFGASGRVWVKVSAAYRCSTRASSFVRDATLQLLDNFGHGRLMWGSDWPHTQFEHVASYGDTLADLAGLNLNSDVLDAILGSTAHSFYRFK